MGETWRKFDRPKGFFTKEVRFMVLCEVFLKILFYLFTEIKFKELSINCRITIAIDQLSYGYNYRKTIIIDQLTFLSPFRVV